MKKRYDENVAIVEFDEEPLDARNYQERKEELQELIEDDRFVVLDLRSVNFIDSSGLSIILSCLRSLKGRDGTLAVVYVNSALRTVFEIVQLHKIVSLHETLVPAVDAMKVAAQQAG
jgi:anti-sigma B factor antagonist